MTKENIAAQGQDAEPRYQIKLHYDTVATWRDCSREAYDLHPEGKRRIVYSHPPSAQAETPVDDKAHPRFLAGYAAGLKDGQYSAKAESSGSPGKLSDDEILQVFADAVGNQEPDARLIDVDRDQAIRIAHELLRRGAAQAQAPAEPVSGADGLPYFAHKIIEKLARADECFSEGEGADIGRHWLDMLTQLGLLNRVQINPAIWEITVQGEEVLHGHSNRL